MADEAVDRCIRWQQRQLGLGRPDQNGYPCLARCQQWDALEQPQRPSRSLCFRHRRRFRPWLADYPRWPGFHDQGPGSQLPARFIRVRARWTGCRPGDEGLLHRSAARNPLVPRHSAADMATGRKRLHCCPRDQRLGVGWQIRRNTLGARPGLIRQRTRRGRDKARVLVAWKLTSGSASASESPAAWNRRIWHCTTRHPIFRGWARPPPSQWPRPSGQGPGAGATAEPSLPGPGDTAAGVLGVCP